MADKLNDPKVTAEKRAALDRRGALQAQDLLDLIGTDQGKRIIWGLIEENGLMRSISVGDPALTAMQIGRREVAVKLYSSIKAVAGYQGLYDCERAYLLAERGLVDE